MNRERACHNRMTLAHVSVVVTAGLKIQLPMGSMPSLPVDQVERKAKQEEDQVS